MVWLVSLVGAVALLVAGLRGWRALDIRADRSSWQQLTLAESAPCARFDPKQVADLPEPARRYFEFTIRPGAPLHSVTEIEMEGCLGLGSKGEPRYRPMRAHQILAPPHGLVWQLHAGPISGSDGATPEGSWTRFWLFGLLPIVRASGPDHHRSAFGRVAAEAAFWAPGSLLPSKHVRWVPAGDATARFVVRSGPFEQVVDILVAEDGRPTQVTLQRWSNENPEKEFREQPFGGCLSRFEDFGGYRLPTHVEGGNHIGTPDYFPFFKADVRAIRFPGADRT